MLLIDEIKNYNTNNLTSKFDLIPGIHVFVGDSIWRIRQMLRY
jgi:hypothetical protein